MRASTKGAIVTLIVLTFALVGELSVLAMGAPTEMAHSQAHVMGLMCKGGGRGPAPRDLNGEDDSTNSVWRILDTTNRTYFSADVTIGILEYLNKADCEASARTLNRKYGTKVRYVCKAIRQ